MRQIHRFVGSLIGSSFERYARGKSAADLARELDAASTDLSTTVEHDGMGPLTVAGWLGYLIRHPEFEARTRLRGGRSTPVP